MLLAAAAGVAQAVFAIKMKAGRKWARLALTVLTGITLALAALNSMTGMGQNGNWVAFLASLTATVLMWLPNSQARSDSVRGRNTSFE